MRAIEAQTFSGYGGPVPTEESIRVESDIETNALVANRDQPSFSTAGSSRPGIAMMEPADLGDGHDGTDRRRLNASRDRCIPLQREMGT